MQRNLKQGSCGISLFPRKRGAAENTKQPRSVEWEGFSQWAVFHAGGLFTRPTGAHLWVQGLTFHPHRALPTWRQWRGGKVLSGGQGPALLSGVQEPWWGYLPVKCTSLVWALVGLAAWLSKAHVAPMFPVAAEPHIGHREPGECLGNWRGRSLVWKSSTPLLVPNSSVLSCI